MVNLYHIWFLLTYSVALSKSESCLPPSVLYPSGDFIEGNTLSDSSKCFVIFLTSSHRTYSASKSMCNETGAPGKGRIAIIRQIGLNSQLIRVAGQRAAGTVATTVSNWLYDLDKPDLGYNTAFHPGRPYITQMFCVLVYMNGLYTGLVEFRCDDPVAAGDMRPLGILCEFIEPGCSWLECENDGTCEDVYDGSNWIQSRCLCPPDVFGDVCQFYPMCEIPQIEPGLMSIKYTGRVYNASHMLPLSTVTVRCVYNQSAISSRICQNSSQWLPTVEDEPWMNCPEYVRPKPYGKFRMKAANRKALSTIITQEFDQTTIFNCGFTCRRQPNCAGFSHSETEQKCALHDQVFDETVSEQKDGYMIYEYEL